MARFDELRRQVAIAGTVTDQENGGPIAGVRVTLTSAEAAFADWLALKALPFGRGWDSLAVRADRTLTRDDGRFCFLDLPDGAYTVTAEWLSQGDRYGVATGAATIARGSDGGIKLSTVDLALPPTRITGKVDIKTVAAAMAEVRLRGGGESTFTDGEGVYVLSAIEPGQRIVRAQVDGLAPMDSSVTIAGRGQSATVNFSLS